MIIGVLLGVGLTFLFLGCIGWKESRRQHAERNPKQKDWYEEGPWVLTVKDGRICATDGTQVEYPRVVGPQWSGDDIRFHWGPTFSFEANKLACEHFPELKQLLAERNEKHYADSKLKAWLEAHEGAKL